MECQEEWICRRCVSKNTLPRVFGLWGSCRNLGYGSTAHKGAHACTDPDLSEPFGTDIVMRAALGIGYHVMQRHEATGYDRAVSPLDFVPLYQSYTVCNLYVGGT